MAGLKGSPGRARHVTRFILAWVGFAFAAALIGVLMSEGREAAPPSVLGHNGLSVPSTLTQAHPPQGEPAAAVAGGSASAPAALATINNEVIRAALVGDDPAALEAAFDALARCGELKDRRQQFAAIDRNSMAARHLPELEAAIRQDQAFCANADHDLVSRRSTYLRQALVKRFSPGLVARYYMAGPLGDWDQLELRPDDPLIHAWFDDVKGLLERSARQGDLSAMDSLAHIHRNGPASLRDSVQALAYDIVKTEVQLPGGKVLRTGPSTRWLQQQAATLSAADLQRAVDTAGGLLKVCCNSIRITTPLKPRPEPSAASRPAPGSP